MGCEPIVLANLCVTYILYKQNLKAKELIQTIVTKSDSAHSMHMCIVNLMMELSIYQREIMNLEHVSSLEHFIQSKIQ